MKQSILIVCGPTAMGKTSMGIMLAKKFNGEIISADSRQVYKGMDIGTGKEFSKEVKIWGYDLVSPKSGFSVSQFVKFAKEKIKEIQKRNKLPIIVGGTGFYIKALIDKIDTIDIPQNKSLRKVLLEKSALELIEMLSNIDPVKSASLNQSDRKNPRRLIRAVEIAQYNIDNPKLPSTQMGNNIFIQIGLTASKDEVEKRIKERVLARVKMGMKKEVSYLLDDKVSWSNQSMYSLGYRQYRDFFEDRISEEDVINNWINEEIKYAKRQLTWFKKDKRITWFNVENLKSAKSGIIQLCQEKLKSLTEQ